MEKGERSKEKVSKMLHYREKKVVCRWKFAVFHDRGERFGPLKFLSDFILVSFACQLILVLFGVIFKRDATFNRHRYVNNAEHHNLYANNGELLGSRFYSFMLLLHCAEATGWFTTVGASVIFLLKPTRFLIFG
ncbi:hypothetical protein Tcan_00349 [Toxocara canis]|uniref:Uncharacterized protein n=1 Tax=Toxocara canis TaxID=6265 RepID=A0A0B2UQI1_TOXCA|nr:hypothetical protein Tcan_00349 [Toxocara canis]